MKLLKWLFIVAVVLVVALVAIGFVLPDQAHVERSATIDAPPPVVFAVLNGFRNFNQWSPWAELDPDTQYTYEGPVQGVGARMSWASQQQSVGSGNQEILESEPYERIKMRLVFAGFDSDHTAHFFLAPEGAGTRITWTHDTDFKGNLLGRYFGLMLDGMIGPDYEKGLAKLKTFAQGLPKADFAAQTIDLVEAASMPIAYVSAEAGPDTVAATLGAAYGKIQAFMASVNRSQAHAPIAITREYDDASGDWKFDAAIPLDAPCEAPAESAVHCGQTYSGFALKTTHVGPYSAAETAYNALIAYQAAAGWQTNGNSWEHYVVDPATVAEAAIRTDIYWPVK